MLKGPKGLHFLRKSLFKTHTEFHENSLVCSKILFGRMLNLDHKQWCDILSAERKFCWNTTSFSVYTHTLQHLGYWRSSPLRCSTWLINSWPYVEGSYALLLSGKQCKTSVVTCMWKLDSGTVYKHTIAWPSGIWIRGSLWCVCVCKYIYIYIQGVPGGMCQTSGECSLC